MSKTIKKLDEYEIAALLFLESELGFDSICNIMKMALEDLEKKGLVKYEPPKVYEVHSLILATGNYWELTEKGEKARKELLRRLKHD